MEAVKKSSTRTGLEVAVIGMAGRFPHAKNIDEFWDNIKDGVEPISFLSQEELNEYKIGPELLENPNFVKSIGGVLEDKEFFDASFFGYTPKEAAIMHPQLRIFHECAWEALENAGYDPDSYDGLIGLFAGASTSFYWEGLCVLSGQSSELGPMAARFLSDKDHLSTKISHKLNLKGASFTINTACSTALVAIHLACRTLLSGDCDIVLAGGVSVRAEENIGYIYEENMIVSPDGHCRAFDAQAKGTIGGDGIGIVVLKLLEDALEDGDYIHAVVKGSAFNNDGSRKVGYTAPSVDGQAEVIRTAHRLAEVEPESITYIETHGTGTELGDPIEIAGLKLAFNTNKKGFCGIGSVKTNMGHLDAAAGIAGVIKTVMALKHKIIPPSLHFHSPNPKLDLESSPFYVNGKAAQWKNDKYPLRAGVSSFGIGGTNSHVVLEEAPDDSRQRMAGREYQLILLSAKTLSVLDTATGNLVNHLKENPGIDLADVAYTLQVGRKAFQYRRMTVCSNIDEAIESLSDPGSRKVHTSFVKEEKKYLVFMFPGLGAQYVNMGLDLYQSQAVFRKEMDRCFEILKDLLDVDIKKVLYPQGEGNGTDRSNSPGINQAEITQPVIFIFEYALAKLLMQWGIKSQAMIGYSFGEYTAACLSGVFSLEDALKLIVTRGNLIEEMPGGGMLSVPLSREELRPYLNQELSLAIDNGPSCVVSGSNEAIDAFEKKMKENRYICTSLKASRAIHSKMMAPILGKYKERFGQVKLNKPRIPYLSNVTGKWITAEEAVDPGYWAKHLQETVLFSDGVKELLKKNHPIFVEVGPGYDLGALVRHHINNETDQLIVNTVKHPQDKISGNRFLSNKIGHLWLSDVKIDWQEFYAEEKRYRIPLPTYPFERLSYWIEGNPYRISAGESADSRERKKPDVTDWFYLPSWKRSVLLCPEPGKNNGRSYWLMFADQCGFGSQLVNRLMRDGQEVIIVKAGTEFAKEGEQVYTVNPQKNSDYDTLFKELRAAGKIPGNIVHLWGVTESESRGKDLELRSVENAQDLGFYSLLYLVQAIGKKNFDNPFRITVITNNMQHVTGEEQLCSEKATVVGAIKVIPQEYANISCSSIDIALAKPGSYTNEHLIDQLMLELSVESPEKVIAYRSNYRWVPVFEPIRLEKLENHGTRLREKGIYLITGGLGGIGFEIARHLAQSIHARLILTGRSTLPARESWAQWLENQGDEDKISLKISGVRELEQMGAEVLLCSADVANREEMQEVIALAEKRFGRINGVIHSAGLPDGCVIPLRTREITDRILSPKITGTLVLDRLLKDVKLDFFVICSSLSSIIPLFGQVGYCAANAFQDAFAYQKTSLDGVFTAAINWDTWKEVGMGVDTVAELAENENIKDAQLLLENGILNSEGIDVFCRILKHPLPQVVVSTSDFRYKIEQQSRAKISEAAQEFEMETYSGTLYPRPQLSTEYIPPKTEFEKTFCDILKKFFGYDQVGIHDNFFEFGVTSLTLIRINTLLREEINKDIPIVLMFEYPTIGSFGQYLEQEEKGELLIDSEIEESAELEKAEELLYDSIGLLREDV